MKMWNHGFRPVSNDVDRLIDKLDRRLRYRRIRDANLIVVSFPFDEKALAQFEELGASGFAVSDFDQACDLARLSTISWDCLILCIEDEVTTSRVAPALIDFMRSFPEIGVIFASRSLVKGKSYFGQRLICDVLLHLPAHEKDLDEALEAAKGVGDEFGAASWGR